MINYIINWPASIGNVLCVFLQNKYSNSDDYDQTWILYDNIRLYRLWQVTLRSLRVSRRGHSSKAEPACAIKSSSFPYDDINMAVSHTTSFIFTNPSSWLLNNNPESMRFLEKVYQHLVLLHPMCQHCETSAAPSHTPPKLPCWYCDLLERDNTSRSRDKPRISN